MQAQVSAQVLAQRVVVGIRDFPDSFMGTAMQPRRRHRRRHQRRPRGVRLQRWGIIVPSVVVLWAAAAAAAAGWQQVCRRRRVSTTPTTGINWLLRPGPSARAA